MKIPDFTALGPRRIPQASAPVSTSTGGELIARGLSDVADVAYKIGQKEARYQSSAAEAQLIVDLTNKEIELDEADYDDTLGSQGYVDQFSEAASDIVGRHAESISDPEYRSRFLNQSNITKLKARERVRDTMFRKESAFRVGKAAETLTSLRDSAVASGQIGDSYLAAGNLLQSLSDNGYIDEVKRSAMLQTYKDDVAVGRLDFIAPEERMGELKKIKKFMHPDTYAKYLRQAEDDLITYESQSQVDDFMDAYDDSDATLGELRDAGMTAIENKYGDKPKKAKLRAAAEKRLDYEINKRSKAELEHSVSIFDKYDLQITTGETATGEPFDYSMIPREELNDMTPKMRQSLRAIQSNRVAPVKVPWNQPMEDDLTVLLNQKNYQEIVRITAESAGVIEKAQLKKWRKVGIDGLYPDAPKSAFTVQQTVFNKLPGLTREQRAPDNDVINQWIFDYQEREHREPTDIEIDNRVDTLIKEYDTSWWWGGAKPVFKMDEEEMQDAVVLMKEDEPEVYDDTIEFFKRTGRQPDMPEFMEKMQLLKEIRSGAQ